MGGAALPKGLAPWTGFGWIGVELFFVISGYVIACSAAGAATEVFLRRRAQRLLPAAWVCASLSLVALVAAGAGSAALGWQWLRSVTFWPLGDAIDPSYWTLGIETAFYLLVALRLRGGASPERIERVAWWIGGASLAFWLAVLATGALDGGWMRERLAQLLLLPHGAFFAIGMLLQASHRDRPTRARSVGLALFCAAGAVEIVAHARWHAADMHLPVDWVTPLAVFAAGVALIAACRRVQPALARWTRLATMLGLMTYPLYLLHQQLGAAMLGLLGPVGLVSACVSGLALSWAVVRFAEPVLREAVAAAFRAGHGLRRDSRPNAFH